MFYAIYETHLKHIIIYIYEVESYGKMYTRKY